MIFYFCCFFINSSIFLRLSNSELSLTFVENYYSLFFLQFTSYCLCLASISLSALFPSWLISLILWSIKLLNAASSFWLAFSSSLNSLLWRCSISYRVLASKSIFSCQIFNLFFSASMQLPFFSWMYMSFSSCSRSEVIWTTLRLMLIQQIKQEVTKSLNIFNLSYQCSFQLLGYKQYFAIINILLGLTRNAHRLGLRVCHQPFQF